MTPASNLERHFLELVNAARADIGQPALRLELNLNESARAHSQWMTAEDTFNHTGVGGSRPADRMEDAGYDFAYSWRATENIGAVTVSGAGSYLDEVNQLFTNLMNSPGHRANILDANVTSLGVGLAFGPLTYSNGSSYDSVLITNNFARTLGVEDFDLYGGADADMLTGDRGDDRIDGEGGNDILLGVAGNDTMLGEGGNDEMSGGTGDDLLYGGTGDDTLSGDAGNDTLAGNDGEDMMRGGDGNDRLFGGSGADVLAGNAGNDYLRGGNDNDRLYGGAGDDDMGGDAGNDTIDGGLGADILRGGAGDDLILGGRGADILAGNNGDDTLRGGGDDDRLIAGLGTDLLYGDSGADVFVWNAIIQSVHNAQRDTIADFEHGVDHIDLSGIAPGLTFVGASYTGGAGEVRYNDAIGRLYIDIDGDGGSDFSVDVTGAPVIDAGDLIL